MRRGVITGPPPVQILDVTGPLEVFSNAPGYDIVLATPGTAKSLVTSRKINLGEAIPLRYHQAQVRDYLRKRESRRPCGEGSGICSGELLLGDPPLWLEKLKHVAYDCIGRLGDTRRLTA